MAVVTISRQFGSGGDEAAKMAANQLGYQYFDKDLMAALCDPAKLACDTLADLTEDTHRVQGRIERFFAEYPMSFEETVQRYLEEPGEHRSPEADFEAVESLIKKAYEHGNVVILGRGGQVILHDQPGVLHVRIEAPLEARVGRVQKEHGLDSEKTLDLVMQRDEAAADYVKRFCHADPADLHLYDMVFNTGKLTPETTAAIITLAAGSLNP